MGVTGVRIKWIKKAQGENYFINKKLIAGNS